MPTFTFIPSLPALTQSQDTQLLRLFPHFCLYSFPLQGYTVLCPLLSVLSSAVAHTTSFQTFSLARSEVTPCPPGTTVPLQQSKLFPSFQAAIPKDVSVAVTALSPLHATVQISAATLPLCQRGKIQLLTSNTKTRRVSVDFKLQPILRCALQLSRAERGVVFWPCVVGRGEDEIVLVQGERGEGVARKIMDLAESLVKVRALLPCAPWLLLTRQPQQKSIISKTAVIPPRKLDSIFFFLPRQLEQIMIDTGTYIELPPLGGDVEQVSVYSNSPQAIDRGIRRLLQLAEAYIHASIKYQAPVSFPSQEFARIASETAATIAFDDQTGTIDFHGSEAQVKVALGMTVALPFAKGNRAEIKVEIQLASEHRDFISGKKNGKLNKIQTTCGVAIQLSPPSATPSNLTVTIGASSMPAILAGLDALQAELPAELSFTVPESYHKRIIGVGGKNIQQIMKRLGVYVKFLNAEEWKEVGGFARNEDNVIARTPAKNHMALLDLKMSIMELVNPKDRDYISYQIEIPRKWQHTLCSDDGSIIENIERSTSCAIKFPAAETGSESVEIYGPAAQVAMAAAMLTEQIPIEMLYQLPSSPELFSLIETREWQEFVGTLQRDVGVMISVLPGVNHGPAEVRLSCGRSVGDMLQSTWNLLQEYMRTHNVPLVAAEPAIRRRAGSDSFTSAFPHFPSRIIPSSAGLSGLGLEKSSLRVPARRLRAAASTSDVKALFDNASAPNPSPPPPSVISHLGNGSISHTWVGSLPEDEEAPFGDPASPIIPLHVHGPPRAQLNHTRNRSDFFWPPASTRRDDGLSAGANIPRASPPVGGSRRTGRHASMDLRGAANFAPNLYGPARSPLSVSAATFAPN